MKVKIKISALTFVALFVLLLISPALSYAQLTAQDPVCLAPCSYNIETGETYCPCGGEIAPVILCETICYTNEQGEDICSGGCNDPQHDPQAVPEPATMLLFSAGLAGAAIRKRFLV